MNDNAVPNSSIAIKFSRFWLFWWNQWNLKAKTTSIAVLIGVCPLVAVGGLAYLLNQNSIVSYLKQQQLERTKLISDNFAYFIQNHWYEAKNLSQSPIFTDSKLRSSTTIALKQKLLENYQNNLMVFEDIAFFDVRGNLQFSTPSTTNINNNYSRNAAFQQALKTKQIILNQPQTANQKISLDYFVPVLDNTTQEVVGILILKISDKSIYQLLQPYQDRLDEWQLVNSEGIVFAGIELDNNDDDDDEVVETYHLDRPIGNYFPEIEKLQATQKSGIKSFYNSEEEQQEVVSYHPISIDNPILQQQIVGMGAMIKSNEAEAFSTLRSQRLTLLLVTSLITVLVIAIAVHLANRTTIPLIDAARAVKKIGRGELDTRLKVTGEDELGELSSNINLMAQRIQELLQQQKLAAEEQMKSQAAIAEQERKSNEAIQTELFQFLSSIESASSGDLTVRANITDGSIGIVADFFNSIIENLRDIVTKVKTTTSQVNTSVGDNEDAIRQVAEEALKQTNQISQTLNAVETMANSIQEVAQNAKAAAQVSRTASATAETGGQAIEQTVNSILQLRETIASTAKKVKRLGESSQEISKVISLIEQIAMQTNLLAINASIEASRAGEEGRGFAVVAEEVGELAAKSAAATQEIEAIVENIQEETQEVVAAMEIGTAQVVEGTRLVENTKQSLDQIVSVSHQIDRLLQSISIATISQAETSQTLTKLMEEVSQVSQRTSTASHQVSNSLEATVKIAQELQASVGTFRV